MQLAVLTFEVLLRAEESSGVRLAAWSAVMFINPKLGGLIEGSQTADLRSFRGKRRTWNTTLEPTAFRIGKGSYGVVMAVKLNCEGSPRRAVLKLQMCQLHPTSTTQTLSKWECMCLCSMKPNCPEGTVSWKSP